MKRIVVISDMQVPYHDPRAVAAVQQFVLDYQPDELMCVGDEADSPEPSRWNKGSAGEFAGTLQRGLDMTADIMIGFKEALGDKPFNTMRSNHGDRVSHYVNRYAPALASLRELEYAKLLRYAENDITYHDRFYSFAKGWILAHGDEGSLSRTAGGTAMALARKTGTSVVCGHTHRTGIQHEHTGYNGTIRNRLYGVEVGHLMDLRQASYLNGGTANWQQAFGLLHINDKGVVTPTIVPITNKSFVVEGQEYVY
jgi:predicted phosphodiesterase